MPAESTTPTVSAESPGVWWRLRYVYRRRLGALLKAVRLHRWSCGDGSSDGWQRKSRRPLSEWLLPIGNLYLAVQRAPSRVLSARDWLRREQLVAEALSREVGIDPDRRALTMRWESGSSLRQILASGASIEEKLAASQLAAAALRRLHALPVVDLPFCDSQFSHGDATCDNVIVDLAAETAGWIDFDTQHRADLSHDDRRADDLCVLLFSTAGCLPEHHAAECVAAVAAGYDAPASICGLARTLHADRCPTVFQLAQAPLSARRFEKVKNAIRDMSR
ncbi:MAG: hypothetical protein NT069_01870 [Planctomycetota bacterium]|nr:hypothetical protein [Planctomycetota bacterium]